WTREQWWDIQVGLEGQCQHDDRRKSGQVTLGVACNRTSAIGVEAQSPGQYVGRRRYDKRDPGQYQQELLEHFQKRELKDVEAEVSSQYRIDFAEWLGMSEQQPILPAARRPEAEQQRNDGGDQCRQRLRPLPIDVNPQWSFARHEHKMARNEGLHRHLNIEKDRAEVRGHRDG